MTISLGTFTVLVGGALLVTALAPIYLLVLWVRDWKRRGLW
jgi:hypothetical protein